MFNNSVPPKANKPDAFLGGFNRSFRFFVVGALYLSVVFILPISISWKLGAAIVGAVVIIPLIYFRNPHSGDGAFTLLMNWIRYIRRQRFLRMGGYELDEPVVQIERTTVPVEVPALAPSRIAPTQGQKHKLVRAAREVSNTPAPAPSEPFWERWGRFVFNFLIEHFTSPNSKSISSASSVSSASSISSASSDQKVEIKPDRDITQSFFYFYLVDIPVTFNAMVLYILMAVIKPRGRGEIKSADEISHHMLMRMVRVMKSRLRNRNAKNVFQRYIIGWRRVLEINTLCLFPPAPKQTQSPNQADQRRSGTMRSEPFDK